MRVIILLALIGATCAVPKNSKSFRNSNRIVGGEETTIEDYPFMASILFNSLIGILPHCGGSLVSSTSVVSAAHCYVNSPPSVFKVHLGSTLVSSGGKEHVVSNIVIHTNFSYELAINDLAMIKLTDPAVISEQINIVRIAGPNYILLDNTVVYAIGWGETEEGPTEVLRHVAVNIINQRICTERYAFLKRLPWLTEMPVVTPEMICTGILNEGGKDACQGDSGGPVIHNSNILVGITSWGHRCGSRLFPGVNVRVSSQTEWIYNNALD